MRSRPAGRVVLVIDTLAAGGAERHLARLATGLRQSGRWDVSVFCLNRTGPFVREMEAAGIPVGGDEVQWSRRLALRWTFRLIRHFRAERPTIAHCYLNTAGIIGAIAARVSGVPHVITTRRVVHEFRGPKLVFYRAVAALMDRLSDRVIAVSDAARAQALAEGTPARKITTIPNGVVIADALPAPLRVNNRFTLLVVARLHPHKGHRYLVSAMPSILASVPEVRLQIAGDGPERGDLESLARRLGVTSRVEFLGERSDVPQLLASADLFVLPSLIEGMPNAIMEAMAAGLPVVATRVGGIPELLTHELTGLLVEPALAAELSAAVIRMASDGPLRTRCAVGGQESVRHGFGCQQELNATEAVYLSLVTSPSQKLVPQGSSVVDSSLSASVAGDTP